MTRCQSRWINAVIIALVVILRAPTLLPSLYTTDEGYYGTIANDILTVAQSTARRWIRSRRACITFTPAFSGWLGGTTSLQSTSSPYLSSWPQPSSYGESVREWR